MEPDTGKVPMRGEPRRERVSFQSLAADGKGRLFGLDRAGRVWASVFNADRTQLLYWERLTDKGHAYADA